MSSDFLKNDELEPGAKKARREKDSSKAARRGFSKAQRAFSSRLSRPGYVAACNSRKPEALVKVVADAPRGQGIRRLLHYVSRTQGVELAGENQENVYLANQDEGLFVDRKSIEELATSWVEKAEAEYAEGRKREVAGRMNREVQHIVLSAKAETTTDNLAKIIQAAKQTAQSQFAGYEYVIGAHQDGKYPHAHLVVRCTPLDSNRRKLRINRPELLQLRTIWARELTRLGLEHVATLRQDRPHVMAAVAEGKEALRGKRLGWFQATLADKEKGIPFLAKRQEDLAKALERQASRGEASAIRQEIGQRINDLRAHIKANTEQNDPHRRKAFGELLKIERQLKKNTDPLLRFRELAEKAGKHEPAYSYISKSLVTGIRLPKSENTRQTQEEIQKAYELHKRNLEAAKAEVRRIGGMNKEQFLVAMHVLEIQDRAVRKALGIKPESVQGQGPKKSTQVPQQPGIMKQPKKPRESGLER